MPTAQPGFYTISVSATPVDKRYVGGTGAKLSLKLMTSIKLIDVEMYSHERDAIAATAANTHKFV